MKAIIIRRLSHQFKNNCISLLKISVYGFSSNCPRIPQINPPQKKKWVNKVFGKYLLITNIVSSGTLMSVADLLQQEIEYTWFGKHATSFDWNRCYNMGLIGTALAPFTHFFYLILDKWIPGKNLVSIAKKIFWDQIFASPISITISFFGAGYLSNRDYKAMKEDLINKFWFIYAVDCAVWIPVQFLNFYFFSKEFRVTFINVVTITYDMFISFVLNN